MSAVGQIPGAAPIADSALPAAIRSGSEDDKKAYKAAMGFEQMMLQQLVTELSKSASSSASAGDEDSDSGLSMGSGSLLGGGGPWASQIQETLAQQLSSGGGIGLAQQLYQSLKPDTTAADKTSVKQNGTTA